ncbi:GerAB/ArcD/ProY family transporter [Paenibacillus protaetiae]|uniref:Uncharacterized protein n=1 Tax=Paenibacillus protaetiae TaxID=2509456 RepID=A0A4V0YEY2_9BACL|nr:GerAB/ArcD/ProY family transporter [Paenibacillus protaetiae]QAY65801.1 hypothetical protein ET464_04795 [Paenibacillus protaetiae]
MRRGISAAAFFLVLQYGLFIFVYTQCIIQSQPSGQWLFVMLGWLIQGIMLRLLIGGFKADKSDLLSKLNASGKWLRLGLVWPLLLSNLLTIGIIIRGHSQVLSVLYLPNTPIGFMLALLLCTALTVAYAGKDSLLRLSLVIGCLMLPLVLLAFIAVLKYVNPDMIFPIQPSMEFMTKPKLMPVFFILSNVFSLIAFVGPHSSVSKYWIWGAWGFSLLLFLLNVYLPVSVFGQEVVKDLRFPSLLLLDSVRVDWFFFDGISLFYILAIMISTLLNISSLLWLTRQLTVQSAFVPKLMTNPASVSLLAIAVAYAIPNLESLEILMVWGGPLRFALLLMLGIIGVYYRKRAKTGEKPRA